MKHTIAANKEWGSKARKEEDRLRGLNNRDRRADIEERLQGKTIEWGWLDEIQMFRDAS